MLEKTARKYDEMAGVELTPLDVATVRNYMQDGMTIFNAIEATIDGIISTLD